MDYPKRKRIRLEQYDYSSPGAYFITICTEHRQNLFWKTDSAVGAAISRPQNSAPLPEVLTEIGALVDQAIQNIPTIYQNVSVDKYVIMPNHLHLLLQMHELNNGRLIAAPTVNTIIGQMKRWVSKQAGSRIWQKSFHEHIVRNDTDYCEIWQYIEANPYRWSEDCFFEEEKDKQFTLISV